MCTVPRQQQLQFNRYWTDGLRERGGLPPERFQYHHESGAHHCCHVVRIRQNQLRELPLHRGGVYHNLLESLGEHLGSHWLSPDEYHVQSVPRDRITSHG